MQKQLTRSGFRLLRRYRLPALGLFLSTFRTPADMSAPQAVRSLRQRFPHLPVSINHRYQPLGAPPEPPSPPSVDEPPARCTSRITLGLLDGAVHTAHPALQGRDIRVVSLLRPGETPGGTGHATALASLLMGDGTHGGLALLPRARLVNAAVYRQRGETVDASAEAVL
ncbi:hypothetical protein, partial [Sulfurivirga sp.]|uniref:hypothetical protein n=1 Tax=Sulfurivirga sp. TaxID=2614236 RepID=UPI0025F3E0CF